ncbi:MAG TPA: cytidylate kinase-like family protein [Candidatus Baltobacteraceae bacterium]
MVVTISRQYGSAAIAVARALEEELGYRIVHDELPTVVATRLGISREAAERVEAGPKTLPERILRGFSQATPEFAPAQLNAPDIDADYVRVVEEAVREAAEIGNCIIVGRAAGRVLIDRDDVVRVLLRAPLAWRTVRVMESLGCDERAARVEIARVEEARTSYEREHYGVEREDMRLYHLIVDVARFGIEGAATVIASGVRACSHG